MCFGGGGGSRDDSLSVQSAALTREQYEDYVTRFQPIEESVISNVMGANGGLGNQQVLDDTLARASTNVNRQYGVAEGAMGRNLGRQGIDLTAERAQTAQRGLDIGSTLSEISARNNARTAVEDRDLTTAANMAGMGRGIAANASSSLGTSASMEASRNASNQQLAQQRSASNTQAGLSAAGLAIAAYAAL